MQRLVKSGNMNIKQRWRWRSPWRKNCLVWWLLTNQGPEKSNKIKVNAHCLVHDRALKKKEFSKYLVRKNEGTHLGEYKNYWNKDVKNFVKKRLHQNIFTSTGS